MTLKQVMAQLEKLGTELYRKVLPRHGIEQPFFGVKYADLYKLQKQLAGEHELALELWQTGNHDARILATLIVDAAALGSRQLDGWIRDAENRVLMEAVAGVVARSAHGRKKADLWLKTKAEWKCAAGWSIVAHLAAEDPGVPDAWFADKLTLLETGIDNAPNFARHTMNQALIAIGSYRAALRADVFEAAKRLGKIDVDHGGTSCKTPDAIPYIKKVVARLKSKKKTATPRKPAALTTTSRKKRKAVRKAASSRRAR